MTLRTISISFLFLLFFSCSQTINEKNHTWEQITSTLEDISHDKLIIPKYWTEIINKNGEWLVYQSSSKIPSKFFNIESGKNQTDFSFMQNYEELGYRIDEIKDAKDSLLFMSLGNNETGIDRVFTFKYIDTVSYT